ncbi:MAG: hypothetical protein Q8P17_00825, partial [bacterium]|nr:hypothetical protein [bacterium]
SATPIVVNDYVRMCRTYCIMLWTYWEALKIPSISLEELRLIRNCLVHHEGDIAKYSQDPKYGSGGTSLLALTNGKSYVQGYSLVIADSDLVDFTTLVKTEFTTSTGVLF